MTEHQNIRHRPDGSIDTDHYIRKGRVARSAVAHAAAGAALRSARKPVLGLAALIALLPFIGPQG